MARLRRMMAGLLVAALPLVAQAQESPLRALMTADETREWDGVGRLDLGGGGFCTASLIAPQLVLTAAHCLFDKRTGARLDEAGFQFLAGWRDGRAQSYRGVRRALPHPEFVPGGSGEMAVVARDIALVELDRPIRDTQVLPFPTQKRPADGAEVGVVSYAHDRSERPSLQELCHVLDRRSQALILSCDVDFGSSGAPVFVIEDGQPRIVSVVSAKAQATSGKVSLGASLEAPLAELMALMNRTDGIFTRAEPRVERLSASEARRRTGAKFVRP